MPKDTNLAFLQAIEAENFLQKLEDVNFDIFDETFRKRSIFKMPYNFYAAAKSGAY